MFRRILLAALVGVIVTLLLIAASFAADDAGYEGVSNVLFWQNWLLQALLPAPDTGTVGNPFARGMPPAFTAWFSSVLLGFVIYGVGAYFAIPGRRDHPDL